MTSKNSRVWTNTFSQIFGRGIVLVISLILTGFLTRSLGASLFGDYVFISSIVLLFTGLSDLGANILGVRDASLKKEEAGKIFSGIFSFRLILSFLLFLLFLLLSNILPQFKEIKTASLIASFVIPFLIFKTTSQSILQVYLRLDKSAFLEIFSSVSFFLLLLLSWILNSKLTLFSIMFFWSLSALFSSLLSWIMVRKYLQIKIRFNIKEIKGVFYRALPLGAYFLIYSFYDRGIDTFFLKTFSSSEAVGLYGLAYKIHGNLILGAAFLMNSLFPILSSVVNNKEKFSAYFKKSFTLLITLGVMLFIIFFISSNFIIKFISGNFYLVSSGILKVLLFATVVSYLNHLTGYVLISLNEKKKILLFSFISLVVNLILNFIFIPMFSYWAAAVITIFTESSMLVMTLFFLKKKYKIFFTPKDYFDNLKSLLKYKNNYFEIDE